jgi:hypothetical protein
LSERHQFADDVPITLLLRRWELFEGQAGAQVFLILLSFQHPTNHLWKTLRLHGIRARAVPTPQLF